MSFQYVCQSCDAVRNPSKRLDEEKCWICGQPLEPHYICICGEKIPYEDLLRNSRCPNCHNELPTVQLARNERGSATMSNDKLAISVKEETSVNVIKNIENVNLEVNGDSLAQVEDPSFAEFSSVTDYEQNDKTVNLDFGMEQESDFSNVKRIRGKSQSLNILRSFLKSGGSDGENVDVSESAKDRFRKVVSALSQDGALKILTAAETELRSKREVWKEFDLSKKQYYSRLRLLRDLDLISKRGDAYILTDFGSEVMESLSDLGFTVADFEGETIYEDREDYSKSISTYDGFIDEIVRTIKDAENQIRFADILADRRILKKLLDCGKNLEFRAILSEREFLEVKQIMKNFPKEEIDELKSLLSGSFRKYSNLPYGFVLRDDEETIVEMRNILHSKNFHQGFCTWSQDTYRSFKKVFSTMYRNNGEN